MQGELRRMWRDQCPVVELGELGFCILLPPCFNYPTQHHISMNVPVEIMFIPAKLMSPPLHAHSYRKATGSNFILSMQQKI
eukprot:1139420-Pelagomonas_calceolata.AAC.2